MAKKMTVWNFIKVLLILLFSILAVVFIFGPRLAFSAENKALPISLTQIGWSFTANENGSKTTPIWAITIGNTEKAEKLATFWTQYFGSYALDGTLWVRPADSPPPQLWRRVIFHRPKNIFETLVFSENPDAWMFIKEDNYRFLLPPPWRELTNEQLDKVDFIVTYFTGDTKVYLKNNATIKEAKELFEWALDAAR